jgi:hypothetical protein
MRKHDLKRPVGDRFRKRALRWTNPFKAHSGAPFINAAEVGLLEPNVRLEF